MKGSQAKERGMALITVLLAIVLFTGMMLGFYFLVTSEMRITTSDRDNSIAYYGAQAGLEKMSSDLATWFVSHASPTPAQIDGLTAASYIPNVPGVTFPCGGTSPCQGYKISYQTNVDGTLKSTTGQIGGSGPLQGLQGIITNFTLGVIAQGPNGTEVKLTRGVQEVAVPVFQFGIFSDSDLSFFAGPNFGFGGRVHTNGHLFVTEGDGSTLTLADRVTVFKEVIRTQLSNGWPSSSNYNGAVDVLVTGPSTYHDLTFSEGSLTGGPGSSANPNWKNISLVTCNGNLKTKLTGAKRLNLALALAGATPIETIRRPPSGESPTGEPGQERFFNQASLRLLLSDQAANLLPPYTATTSLPVPLDATLNSTLAAPYGTSTANSFSYTVDACRPPMAISPGGPGGSGSYQSADFTSPVGTPLLGGYIKIEMQLNNGTWQDVTMEILNQGIQQESTCTRVAGKTYYPILHIQKLMPTNLRSSPAASAGSTIPYDYIPVNLYDAREGEVRDVTNTNVALNGVMNVVELDVANLQKYFAGSISGTSGNQALNNSGNVVYFSDRRGNHNALGNETGEYGNEDIINPSSSTGAPNGTLDPPEDVNGNGTLDTYGATPLPPTASVAPLGTAATPLTRVTANVAQKNRVIFFRRSLRLVDGALGKLPALTYANCGSTTAGGFTVAAENPVYILGNYNADSTNGFNDTASLCHVPSAVMGDAVTLLSNSWQDSSSFSNPTNPSGRSASTTWYRTAIFGGKNLSFPQPTGYVTSQDFGTDGGTHNFLRYLENWSGQTLSYRGSMVSFYISRQATGVYKCCTVVYNPPTRNYAFDTDFQTIGKLPPATPRFTDVNALSYKQALLPNQ